MRSRRLVRRRGRANDAAVARIQRGAAVCGSARADAARLAPMLRGGCVQTLAAAATSSDPSARAAAAGHRLTHPAWRRRLRSDTDATVRWAPPTAEACEQMSQEPCPGVRTVAAACESCPPRVLASLVTDRDEKVRRAAARNEHTPISALRKRIARGDLVVARAAASNPSTPTDMLVKLSSRTDPEIRAAVAAHLSTPGDVLAELSSSTDPKIRAAVAAHLSTPSEILEALAADSDWRVLPHVAANLRTPVSALRRLGINADGLERLVSNPNCPTDILESVASGSCRHDVRCDGDECQWNGVDREDVLAGILINPSTPATLIESLYEFNIDSPEMLFAVVRVETDPEKLAEWASHDEMYVRRDLARNPHLSTATLVGLASGDDDGFEIRDAVATHPNCPPSTLADLFQKGANPRLIAAHPKCPTAILEELASGGHHLSVVASNPSCPPPVLDALSTHSDPAVRAQIATNPSSWPQSLTTLASDPDEQVLVALATRAAHPQL